MVMTEMQALGAMLHRHERIATTCIASHVLPGVPIQDLTPEHRVREARTSCSIAKSLRPVSGCTISTKRY